MAGFSPLVYLLVFIGLIVYSTKALDITFYEKEKFQGDSFTNQVATCQMIISGNYSTRERSAVVNNGNSSGCVALFTTPCCAGNPLLQVNGSVEKIDKDVVSISPCGGDFKFSPPPEQPTLVVNFLGNVNRTTTRTLTDQTVAVYESKALEKSSNATWMAPFILKTWNHVLKNYYNASKDIDRKLYGVFLTGFKSSERVTDFATYMSCAAEWRNLIITRAAPSKYENNPETPEEPMPVERLLAIETLREVSVIVEASNYGVRHSPSRDMWGNEGWRDIFIYDILHAALGYSKEANNWKNERFNEPTMRESATFPKGNKIYYLRDWFFPIYRQYGKSKVFSSYFRLIFSEFPKVADEFHKQKYSRRMNLGEFVHFWSGAAGQNLKSLATNAFGWNDSTEKKFQKAQKEFDKITYAN